MSVKTNKNSQNQPRRGTTNGHGIQRAQKHFESINYSVNAEKQAGILLIASNRYRKSCHLCKETQDWLRSAAS